MIDLDKIDARAKAATEGPWTIMAGTNSTTKEPFCCIYGKRHFTVPIIADLNVPDPKHKANGPFIAASRTDVPALVAECRASRKVVEALLAKFPDIDTDCDLEEYETLRIALAEYDEATK